MSAHKMTYLWTIPDEYPAGLVGEYDKNTVPDGFNFKRGTPVSNAINVPVRNFENSTLSRLSTFGGMSNNVMVPLVDAKVCAMLSEISAIDVQFCNVIARAKNGDSHDYKLVNVTNVVQSIIKLQPIR